MLSRNCITLLLMGLLWVLGSTVYFACGMLHVCSPKNVRYQEHSQVTAIESRSAQTADVPSDLTLNFGINDDSIITPNADAELAARVAYVASHKDARFVVAGHTNAHSNTSFTDTLGLARAERVKNMLVAHGVSENQVSTVSFGQRELVGDPRTAEGQAANRRVVVTVVRQ